MDPDERSRRDDQLFEKAETVRTIQDFEQFMNDVIRAWDDGVFDIYGPGKRPTLGQYLHGIWSNTDVLMHDEGRRPVPMPPDWSLFAYIIIRSFERD